MQCWFKVFKISRLGIFKKNVCFSVSFCLGERLVRTNRKLTKVLNNSQNVFIKTETENSLTLSPEGLHLRLSLSSTRLLYSNIRKHAIHANRAIFERFLKNVACNLWFDVCTFEILLKIDKQTATFYKYKMQSQV